MRAWYLLLILSLSACAVTPSSVVEDDSLVLVKSVQLPDRDWLPWYTRFADHCWVDFKDSGGWWRAEWNKHTPEVQLSSISEDWARSDDRWEMYVQVHSVTTGEAARRIATQIHSRALEFPYQNGYRAFPGPNSNTFVEWLALECGIRVELPTTALGKDYTPLLRLGVTTTATGIAFDTLPVGVEVGLKEGLAVHLLGLPFGLGIWPPSLKLPFLPAIPHGFFGRGSAH